MDARRFRDRTEAGAMLAELLQERVLGEDAVVLALPRGGVPVAFEVAKALDAPLDVLVVRKVGVPGHEELAMGAVAGDGTLVRDERVIRGLGITEEEMERAAAAELRELERRERVYRDGRPRPELHGKTAILVDDGLATGSTMRAAALAVRAQEPARVVVAVPVAARETCEDLRQVADEIVCGVTPEPFYAVGLWYDDFSQTSDEEVRGLLAQAPASSAIERAEARP